MLYVVDTSVFLSDPRSLERLDSKDVVIPLIVITELEAKRNHVDLGYAARCALRALEEYRQQSSLSETILTENGGSVSVEMNHIDDSALPKHFQGPENDTRILCVALNLQKEGNDVTLLTKDLPLRLRADLVGVKASDWSGEGFVDIPFIETIVRSGEEIDALYENQTLRNSEGLPENAGLIVSSGFSSALGRIVNNEVKLVKEQSVFSLKGKSAEQRIAIDVLRDSSIGIVSLGGKAGAGKSLLAIAAGLDAVLEQRLYKKVTIFRPLYPVGGQDLGYLPGTAEEKMSPWTAAVYDALESFCGPNVIEEIVQRELLEVLPLTHIRGRTLTDTFVIVDEAQNLDKTVLLTALTRIGANSRIVLTHDVDQRDNMRVGKHDGINAVVSRLVGEPLFAHVTLTKSERSPVAELASELLS